MDLDFPCTGRELVALARGVDRLARNLDSLINYEVFICRKCFLITFFKVLALGIYLLSGQIISLFWAVVKKGVCGGGEGCALAVSLVVGDLGFGFCRAAQN